MNEGFPFRARKDWNGGGWRPEHPRDRRSAYPYVHSACMLCGMKDAISHNVVPLEGDILSYGIVVQYTAAQYYVVSHGVVQ